MEADPQTAAALAHNLPLLSAKPCPVHAGQAEALVTALPACDLIYLDPQRRDAAKRGIFRLEDCAPDVLALGPQLVAKAPLVLLKTSPMLDIDRAIATLGGVAAVHVVEWRGECREVLYLLQAATTAPDTVPITAVVLDDAGRPRHALSATRAGERATPVEFALPGAWLFRAVAGLPEGGRVAASGRALRPGQAASEYASFHGSRCFG